MTKQKHITSPISKSVEVITMIVVIVIKVNDTELKK
nr:MAG TPA: hypothetical protein [Caudoviricetes sp.]